MNRKILSLDISSASSGWCLFEEDTLVCFGIISLPHCKEIGYKLSLFKKEIGDLIQKLSPTEVIIEDTFANKNIMTLKILSRFAGVAILTIFENTSKEPFIIHNKSVKKYFEVKNKEELFDKIKDMYYNNCEIREFDFKHHNDITDSIAQCVYFISLIGGNECLNT